MKLLNYNFYSFTGESKQNICFNCVAYKRYLALFLWCFIVLALYFNYDVPGSLQNHIMATFQLSSLQFSYLYSAYSWPNIIMCFVGGFLMDRVFGPKLGLLIYVSIAAVGVFIFILGANTHSFLLLIMGRFVIGIGTESAVVAINSSTVFWFSGKELNMVFAIVTNIGRIGSSLVFEGSEPTYKSIAASGVPQEQVLGRTIIAIGSVILIGVICSILFVFLNPEENKTEENNEKQQCESYEKPVPKLTDVFTFPLQFWLLCILTDFYYNCIYSFLGLAQTSLTTKFNVSNETANRYVSFFSVFGAIISPFVGIIVDKKGRNLFYIMISIVTGIIGFSILAFTSVNPFISMFFLAISIASILSSIWALFSYIIPEHQLGSAFGIQQGLLHVMFSVTSLVSGAILDKYGPVMLELFMIILLAAMMPILIWSWVEDCKRTKILNMSASKREKYLKERAEALQKEAQATSSNEKTISIISDHYNLGIKQLNKI